MSKQEDPPVIGLKKFFEAVPPGRWAKVASIASKQPGQYRASYPVPLPELELHCTTSECDGVRFFAPERELYLEREGLKESFVHYRCRNCRKTVKTFAIWAILSEDEKNGKMYKLGEDPFFGSPTPSRLISLIRDEKDYFLKGRRAENQGLGIAAFAYYRRVLRRIAS